MFRGCGEQPHEPCSCEHWKEWHEKVQQSQPPSSTGNLLTVVLEYYVLLLYNMLLLLGGENVSGQTADNLAWLSSHSKPCPSCKLVILSNFSNLMIIK